MSGSEHGGNGNEQPAMSSPRTIGARSASPAKRSAAHLEDAGAGANNTSQQTVSGSFDSSRDDAPTDFDHVMSGMTPQTNTTDIQDTAASSLATANSSIASFNTSATSVMSVDATKQRSRASSSTAYSTEEIDEQVRKVMQAKDEDLKVGDKHIIVSTRWLERVLSRSSEGLSSNAYSKEAREGLIGPIDNSSIVPENGFAGPFLHDMEKKDFIPLKPGLTREADFETIPSTIWGEVVSWYGLVRGQHQIVRYVKDTEPFGSLTPNLIYDMYPPTFTVRKVPHPQSLPERPPTPPVNSAEELARRKVLHGRGQGSPDDAAQIVSARSERVNEFLKRSKKAAGIPMNTKVKVWRLLKRETAGDKAQQSGVPSPPESRSPSPNKSIPAKLAITPADFAAMDYGSDYEEININDETNNANFNGKSTMDKVQLFEDQTIILEEQTKSGEFASDRKPKTISITKKTASTAASTTTSGRASPAPSGPMTRGRAQRNGKTKGTIGLRNLGNTCYMNSALQCIRSVEELAVYFLSDKYKSEINAGNPLGHGGKMAKEYAGVVNGIYNSTSGGSFTPDAFKSALGRAQTMFNGYGQQDSQEFLSFLVDALHEDLNRIVKKPYNENPDSDDKTVHDPQAIVELGNIYRKNHKARNDSVAMDLFNGFYKNTMECPVCDKVSVTFDPFSLVTVQLPFESKFQHTYTFVPRNGPPVNHDMDLDKTLTFRKLKEAIASKHQGVSADNLWIIEMYGHKIYKVFEDQLTIADANIGQNDYIFVYEMSQAISNVPQAPKRRMFSPISRSTATPEMDSPQGDCFAVPVFPRKKNRYGSGWDIVQHPLYISVSREEAKDYDSILKKALVAVSNITSREILMENDEGQSDDSRVSPADTEKDESAGEDGARVSDRSVPSEDGYIEVSVNGTNGTESAAPTNSPAGKHIPARFMDADYFISPAIRTQIFTMNVAQSSEGPYCASLSSIESRVKNMFDRVTPAQRRASVDSSASEESATSTASKNAAVETEESDADDDENQLKPNEGYGNEDALSGQGSDDEELQPATSMMPESPLDNRGKGRRGKPNKFGGGKGGKKGKKAAKKNKRNNNRNHRRSSIMSPVSAQSPRSFALPASNDENDPYYIKMGEAITLDFYPEAFDGLFGGNSTGEDGMRGYWLSSEDGKELAKFDDPATQAARKARTERKTRGFSLEDCFAETGKREILSEDNSWYCNRCKEMRQAAKTLEIWTIPDILIVHLKRFGGTRSFRDKLDAFIDYPLEGLDMTKRIGCKEDGKEYLYDLFAVDNHYGGLGGGHYTAMAKNFIDGHWYDYNDSSCSKLGEDRVHSAAAYLLFYRRRSDKPLGPEYLQKLVTDFHEPPAEDAGESGEDKLGGHTSSLHGSPSVSAEAGAETTKAHNSYHVNGAGAGADRSLTQSSTTTQTNDDTMDEEVKQRKPSVQDSPGWDFSALADVPKDELPPYQSVSSGDEIDSETAAGDNDSTFGEGSVGNRDRMDDFEDDATSVTAGRSPMADDHAMYSDAHANSGDTMHVENADPPRVDIHVTDADDDGLMD